MKICPTCNRQYEGQDFVKCPYDGSNLVDDSVAGTDPLIGARFGESYQIVRVIGEGGMGKVYEARHVRLSKRYAIKILHPQFNTNPETIARFRREAEAATSIGQENILDVIDFNATPEGLYYIVTEYLEGRNLAQALAEDGVMRTPRTLAILHQMARALAAAHRHSIVHRDLKPENIFLVHRFDSDDFVKVLDFGISKMRSGGDRLTQTGQIIGTPHYMSPEQAQGELNLDHRSDIYSFGAIMYEMFTGRLPYQADSIQQILVKLLTENAPPPRTQRPDLPADIEAVIQRCMAREPARRFQTMDELDHAIIGLFGVHAGPDSPTLSPGVGLSSSPDLNAEPLATLPTLGASAPVTGAPSSPGFGPSHPSELGATVDASSVGGLPRPALPQGPESKGWSTAGRSTPSPVGQHITLHGKPKQGTPVLLVVALVVLVLGGGGAALWFFVLRSKGEGSSQESPHTVADTGKATGDSPQGHRGTDPRRPPPGEDDPRRARPGDGRAPGDGKGTSPEAATPSGMVFVKGGAFTQGRAKGHRYETPEVKGVTVADFYLDAAEVSRREYAAYLSAGRGEDGRPRRSPFEGGNTPPAGTEDLPVTDVTWQEARDYCAALKMRLPTEAEWEYAARGASHDQLYPWGDSFDPSKVVSSVGSEGRLAPVRSGPAFGGFYHLVGNAWEWVGSEFKPYPGSDVTGVVGTQYVIRGGGADTKRPEQLTATYRTFNYGHENPKTKKLATYALLGFRCARDARPTP